MDPFSDLYHSDLIQGYATKEHTNEYFHRILKDEDKLSYSELDGIKISRLGFGCYRINRGNPIFENALELALSNGINLIDTSSNYGDGSSETLVGEVLKNLIHQTIIKREEIFVVTKIGYIQGKNLQLVEEMEKTGKSFTDLVYYNSNCYHCISPDFLEDQLERARKRLGLTVIDSVLLHNPEYFLMDREKHNVSQEKSQLEYYHRIEKAFHFLETKRKLGVIRSFGISSNTFPKEESSYTFTSLEKVFEIAEKVRKELMLPSSGLKIIQFPANLYETGFITEKNTNGKSIVEFAYEKKLFTLVNRPLNAMKKKGGMDRLAIYRGKDLAIVEKSLQNYQLKLKEFQDSLFQSLGIEQEEFTFLTVLENYKDKFLSVEHYRQTLNYSIIPQLKKLLTRIGRLDTNGEFYDSYLHLLNEGIEILEQVIESKESTKMIPLLKKLEKSNSTLVDKTLSQAAVLSILSFNGINSVLVGMRNENYVNDMLPVLISELPKFSEEEFKEYEI
ncbi:MAG: aldo/keto reductase [Leptospiraceae bacterium]|nr:aldo/keto reductase [Leptospiraceae bacterium]